MTLEEKLIDWFARRKVIITAKNAKELINIVRRDESEQCMIVKHRHTYMKVGDTWEKIRTTYLPVDVTKKIIELNNGTQIDGQYMFMVYNPDGTVLTQIFSINPSLFSL